VLGAALGGLLRTPPPIDLSHMAMPRVTLGERSRTCASCCGRGASLRRGGRGRRPRHGRGHAVRAARALQARRGELGAGEPFGRSRCRRSHDAAGPHVEALLFLAPEPVSLDDLRDARSRTRACSTR
jgi:hypothetical protein